MTLVFHDMHPVRKLRTKPAGHCAPAGAGKRPGRSPARRRVRGAASVRPEGFACPRAGCKQGFGTQGDRTKNLHIPSQEHNRVCPHEGCGYASGHPGNLAKHVRCHTGEKPFVCSYKGCGRSFTQAGHLKQHGFLHTGGKPFVCPYEGCGRSFTQSTHLKQHGILHTGAKPFVCSYEGCGRAFTQSTHLKKHRLLHTREKLFSCSYKGCEYAAVHTRELKEHKRCHPENGRQPFVCPHEGCRYVSAVPKNLKQHFISHAAGKGCICPREGCGYSSVYPANLARHRRAHTGERPFVCLYEGCGRSFIQSHHLKQHWEGHRTAGPLVCLRKAGTGMSGPSRGRHHNRLREGPLRFRPVAAGKPQLTTAAYRPSGPWSAKGKSPAQQACMAEPDCSGVRAQQDLAVGRQCQSTGVANDSPGGTTTAASSAHRLLDQGAMPSEREEQLLLWRPVPPSPLLSGTRPRPGWRAPMPATVIGNADWLAWCADIHLSMPLRPVQSTAAFDQDWCASPRSADDRLFWQELIQVSDTGPGCSPL